MRAFDTFTETLDSMPPNGVRRLVELEQHMLEEDVACKRVLHDREIDSILTFCHFFNDVAMGRAIGPINIPVCHLAYYRSVITRLIKAGELPSDAQSKFDAVAGSSFWRLLQQ